MNLDHIRERTDYPALLARFEKLFDVGAPDVCWPWRGGRYASKWGPAADRGWFSIDGQKQTASRVSWVVYRGAIGGHHVLHHCDNPACVHPNHLFLGGPLENMRDMAAKMRSPCRKLTVDDVRAIRASSRNSRDIARELGISYSTIDQLRSRKTWAWLD